MYNIYIYTYIYMGMAPPPSLAIGSIPAAKVKVTFDAVGGKPVEPPMIFQAGHDGLQAVTWNHATWGNKNPPPMKNRSKVKERLTHNKSAD